jgi:hypothetical protein
MSRFQFFFVLPLFAVTKKLRRHPAQLAASPPDPCCYKTKNRFKVQTAPHMLLPSLQALLLLKYCVAAQ